MYRLSADQMECTTTSTVDVTINSTVMLSFFHWVIPQYIVLAPTISYYIIGTRSTFAHHVTDLRQGALSEFIIRVTGRVSVWRQEKTDIIKATVTFTPQASDHRIAPLPCWMAVFDVRWLEYLVVKLKSSQTTSSYIHNCAATGIYIDGAGSSGAVILWMDISLGNGNGNRMTRCASAARAF